MSIRRAVFAAVLLVWMFGLACRQASSGGERAPSRPGAPGDRSQTSNPKPASASASLFEALGRGKGQPLPDGLVPGADCPPAPDAAEDIAAQGNATVPLQDGLTLAYNWMLTPQQPEYECLIQVKKVDADAILTSASCDSPEGRGPFLRRVCRADLRQAHMLHTLYGVVKVIGPSGEEEPETIAGATAFTISSAEFTQLKRNGRFTHHYVELGSADAIAKDGVGELHVEGRETMNVIVNDRPVTIPVIKTRGAMRYWIRGEQVETEDTLVVLDDERFPLIIDQQQSNEKAASRIYFAKITYPSRGASGSGPLRMKGGALEEGLLEEKRVDVYGIYFDFNSDRIRPESNPVLEEIGSIMKAHPDWRLGIQGHTDNVGGNGHYNLELSRRRSEAVRATLVERFGISADRLTSGGSGASSPKDTNDTPEGRARNRRVELVRQ